MKIVRCPACGNEITLADENISAVQCKCGAVIANYAGANGEEGFNAVPELDNVIEKQKKAAAKAKATFLIIYNSVLAFLVGMLIFLLINVDQVIPLYTTIPVLVFMTAAEILFLVKASRHNKR